MRCHCIPRHLIIKESTGQTLYIQSIFPSLHICNTLMFDCLCSLSSLFFFWFFFHWFSSLSSSFSKQQKEQNKKTKHYVCMSNRQVVARNVMEKHHFLCFWWLLSFLSLALSLSLPLSSTFCRDTGAIDAEVWHHPCQSWYHGERLPLIWQLGLMAPNKRER